MAWTLSSGSILPLGSVPKNPPFSRGKALQLEREFALEMEPLDSFEAQQGGTEKNIFSVLLPTETGLLEVFIRRRS